MGPGTVEDPYPYPYPSHPIRSEAKLCAVFGPLSGSVLLGSASDPSSISIHPGSAVMASGGVEIYLPQSHDLAIFQHCNRISFGLFRLDFLFGGSPLLQRNGPCTIYPCSSSSFSSDSISQIPSCILRIAISFDLSGDSFAGSRPLRLQLSPLRLQQMLLQLQLQLQLLPHRTETHLSPVTCCRLKWSLLLPKLRKSEVQNCNYFIITSQFMCCRSSRSGDSPEIAISNQSVFLFLRTQLTSSGWGAIALQLWPLRIQSQS
uniref:HDC15897 n=1 Tax=Drosophila melanogaster TaxID=7227 RepID=Q6IJ48_DROME|nr:TPA_inf: HDC15897 [Drosophila melanogaster]